MKLAAQPESHEESFHRPSELRTSFAPRGVTNWYT